MLVKLSASQVISADDCRRLHWYRNIARVKTEATPANLVFGSAIDEAVRNFLNSLAAGTTPADPDQEFLALWDEARAKEQIQYPATKTPASYREMGAAMMTALEKGWRETGWTVATDKDGKPLTDKFLNADLGARNGVRVQWRGKIDVAVYTALAEFAVVDVKTAMQPHTALFTERSDQLTGYQLLVDKNAEEIGVPPVEKLGFFDLVKRKQPAIEAVTVDRRSDEDMAEFQQKLFWLGEDIKRRRFPKVSRHAFNSPCNLCDYSRHCVHGEKDGLVFPAVNGGATTSLS